MNKNNKQQSTQQSTVNTHQLSIKYMQK